MKIIKRLTAVAVLTSAALAATPASAAATAVTGTKPQAKVTILKPLVLTKTSDLNFGTVLLGTLNGSVSVSMTQGGVVTCGTGLTCSGTTTAGGYNVKGTNKQVVTISAPNVTMNNQTTAGSSIVVTLNAPGTVSLPNSGNTGVDFAVGGSFSVDNTTVDGVYAGDMNVTVDYQ